MELLPFLAACHLNSNERPYMYSNTKASAMPLGCVDNIKPQHAAFDTNADNLIVQVACAWQRTACAEIWTVLQESDSFACGH